MFYENHLCELQNGNWCIKMNFPLFTMKKKKKRNDPAKRRKKMRIESRKRRRSGKKCHKFSLLSTEACVFANVVCVYMIVTTYMSVCI